MIKRVERDDGTRFQVYGRRTVNGRSRQVYVGTYDTRKAAEHAEQDHAVTQRKIAAGELPPDLDDKRTVDVGLDAWLTALEKGKSRSHQTYSWFVTLIRPALGPVAIARVTRKHIIAWRDKLAEDYAPKTVNSALGCLSSAFSAFVDREWITTNPCHGIEGIKVENADTYNWIRTRPELERLLANATGELRDIFAVALGTGLRLDEILHLRWDDVDLAGRLITVQRGRKGPTKSGKARHVPILDSVLPLLQARALRRAGAILVFPSPGNVNTKPGGVRSKPGIGVSLKIALKRAGLDTKIRFHDLRHTFASHWVMSGGDIFRLSKILGHGRVEVTSKTYAHLAPEVWKQDYHRVAFAMPGDGAKVIEMRS